MSTRNEHINNISFYDNRYYDFDRTIFSLRKILSFFIVSEAGHEGFSSKVSTKDLWSTSILVLVLILVTSAEYLIPNSWLAEVSDTLLKKLAAIVITSMIFSPIIIFLNKYVWADSKFRN